MADHLSPDSLARYHKGVLPPDELLAIDDHLAACDVCRERGHAQLAIPAGALTAALRGGRASDHIDFETLEAYVDGRLDGMAREICDTHLGDCRQCAEDLGDIRQARASIAVAPAAAAPDTLLARAARSFWSRAALGATALGATAALVWLLTPTGVPSQGPVGETARESTGPGPGDGRPELVASLRDGASVVGLDRQGALVGLPSNVPQSDAEIVRAALANGRPEIPGFVADLAGRTGTLMGDGGPTGRLALTGPVGTAVESQRPHFEWTTIAGATSYVVAVYDRDFREIAKSPELTTAEWTAPNALARGVTYLWQVTAATPAGQMQAPAPPAPPAQFRVLDDASAADLARAREAYGESPVVMGVLYARAGVIDAARRELMKVKTANPDSTLAAALVDSLPK